MRTRVKICGITRAEDAISAAAAGVDAIGLVFYEKSPRAVNIDEARGIIKALPPFITTVGLFVDPTPLEVATTLHRVSLDILQFHGDESPEECGIYKKPYIKAIRMRPDIDLQEEVRRFSGARGILLDSYDPGIHGGTGKKFDWKLIPVNIRKTIILAGGLTPDNVWQVISTVRPYAVDVSSGVEVEKGIKDADKMSAFMRGVTSV